MKLTYKEGEIWKPVEFDGSWDYAVSNLGRVHSTKRGNGKVLKPFKDSQGYFRVKLFGKTIKKQVGVHQLVAVAFLGHTIDGYNKIVDHINGDIADNRVENLQVITPLENHERGKSPRKSKYRGVYHVPNANSPRKWRAEIYVNGKRKNLGSFETELEAHEAYQQASIEKFNQIVNEG